MSILDPWIKLTLNNDVDLILKAVDNRRSKESMTVGSNGSVGLQVGLATPTCHPLGVCRGGLPSGVFLSLLEMFSSRINTIESDD